jgi:hypothetical protein
VTLSIGEYALGLAYLLVTLGASTLAAVLLAQRRLPHLSGVARALAVATLALLFLVAAHLLPAIVGILSRETAAAAVLLILGGVALVRGRPVPPSAEWPEPAFSDGRLSRALAIAACGAAATYLLAVAVALGSEPATNVDTLTFHLPGVTRWIQTQSIWQIDQFVPDQGHGYYPNTGNVVELAAILPWRSDFAIRLIGLPFVAMTALAVYGAGRELRAPASAAALGAALAISVPAVTVYAVEKPVTDVICLAGFATGALFLLRHNREGRGADLVVAGIALGIAFGTKWYGVSSVFALLGVWGLARLLARHGARVVLRDGAVLLALVTAIGGVWLLRNAIESGNPVFPAEVSVFGAALFDAPRDVIGDLFGHTIADYAFDLGVWGDAILPDYRDFLGAAGGVLAIGLLAGAVLAARSAGKAARGRLLTVGVAAVAAALVYSVTPYSALGLLGEPTGVGVNSRYLVPALLLAAPVTAWAIAAGGRARQVAEVVALLAVLDALRRGTPLQAHHLAIAGVVLAGCAGAWLLLREGSPRRLVALAASSLAVAAILGYFLQERFVDGRYADEPVLGQFASEDGDRRIALAGFWTLDELQPVLPAFGPRLENEVAYLGGFEDGMLRPVASASGFGAALRDGDFSLLLVGKRPLPTRPDLPEEEWAKQAGYRVVGADQRFTLLAAPE